MDISIRFDDRNTFRKDIVLRERKRYIYIHI